MNDRDLKDVVTNIEYETVWILSDFDEESEV